MRVWLPTIRAGSGADIYTERLAAALSRAGCEAVVTWLPHRHELFPQLARIAPPKGARIIHANTWSAFAFTRYGLPTVATEHGFVAAPEFQRAKSWRQRLYHSILIRRYVLASLRRCDQVIAVSGHVAESIRPYCRNPVVTIPNWIDVEHFRSGPRDAGGGPFRVLYAGSRARHKGFDVVQALVRLGLPGVELWCPRELQGRLDPSASTIVFYDRVPHSEMPDLYSRCDAVLVPSRYEGFGYVAAEAMSCGRALIGFDCPSMRWLCGDAAMLVPIDDVAALREVVLALAYDRMLAAEKAAAGRANVLSRFTESRAIEAYLGVYRRLAA